MCDETDEISFNGDFRESDTQALAVNELKAGDELIALARHLCNIPELRSAHLGSIGYGSTREGDRILIAVDLMYDESVVGAVAGALRESGASVDVHWSDCRNERRSS